MTALAFLDDSARRICVDMLLAQRAFVLATAGGIARALAPPGIGGQAGACELAGALGAVLPVLRALAQAASQCLQALGVSDDALSDPDRARQAAAAEDLLAGWHWAQADRAPGVVPFSMPHEATR